jgi:hypothetical protein
MRRRIFLIPAADAPSTRERPSAGTASTTAANIAPGGECPFRLTANAVMPNATKTGSFKPNPEDSPSLPNSVPQIGPEKRNVG